MSTEKTGCRALLLVLSCALLVALYGASEIRATKLSDDDSHLRSNNPAYQAHGASYGHSDRRGMGDRGHDEASSGALFSGDLEEEVEKALGEVMARDQAMSEGDAGIKASHFGQFSTHAKNVYAGKGMNNHGRSMLRLADNCPSGSMSDIGGKGCLVVSVSDNREYTGDVNLRKNGVLSFYVSEDMVLDPSKPLLNVSGSVSLKGKVILDLSSDYDISLLKAKTSVLLIQSVGILEMDTTDEKIEYSWDTCEMIKMRRQISADGEEIHQLVYELSTDRSLCQYSWIFIVIVAILLVSCLAMLGFIHYRDPSTSGIILFEKRRSSLTEHVPMSQYEASV